MHCTLQVYFTNRFHVAMFLFSYRSQIMSKCGKDKIVVHKGKWSVSLVFFYRILVSPVTHSSMETVYFIYFFSREVNYCW